MVVEFVVRAMPSRPNDTHVINFVVTTDEKVGLFGDRMLCYPKFRWY